MTMSTREDYETEAEDSRDSKRSTRKVGFFARRREQKESEHRAKEHEERRKKLRGERKGTRPVIERRSGTAGANKKESSALGISGPRRVDLEARKELEAIQGRRDFLRRSAVGAGILALGAGLGYGSGYAHATGLSGGTRSVIGTDEIAARVIGGVRIATEFIPDPVPAGTDADPFPGSAIQAALNDGPHVYIPAGTWKLNATISRLVDGATIMGAGKSTKLVFDGVSPCISAGSQSGWLIANLAVDAGGVSVSSAPESRFSEIWVNGILTDNRPVATGGGGSGGYYGVRAEDFITQGDGSAANPYNASAIQSAINALPARGGIVFIKSGVWRGTSRITVNATGAERTKKVIFQGEGAMHRQIYFHDAPSSDSARVGTHVQAGFDIYLPCDFYDMEISPHPNNYGSQPCIDWIVDPTKGNSNYEWTVGHTVKRVRFFRGSHGVRYRGVNMGSVFFQVWGVEYNQCGFSMCGRGFRMSVSDIDSTAPSQNFYGKLTNLEFRSCNSGPAFEFDISTSQLEVGNVLCEGCGDPTTGYAFRVSTYGAGGVWIHNIEFGDGSQSPKDAYIFTGVGGHIEDFEYGHVSQSRDVDVGGRGYFGIGRQGGKSGNVNIVSILGPITVEAMHGLVAPIGTVSGNKSNVRILPGPNLSPGFLGSTTPSASPFTYTNQDMYDEVVYIVGGSITDVTRNGQSIGPSREHRLSPGDSIVISYSSAPTIKRFG